MHTIQVDPSALEEIFDKTLEILIGENATNNGVVLGHIDWHTYNEMSWSLKEWVFGSGGWTKHNII